MNTFRDNLEHQIKKQIEEREIAPSRDLWSEIELQKENPHSKFPMNWVLMAACIILVFGLGFVLFSNSSEKNNTQNSKITKVKEVFPQEKTTEKINESTVAEPAYAEEVIRESKEPLAKTINEVQQSPKVLVEQIQKENPKDEVQVIVPEVSKVSAPVDKTVAQAEDAKKTPVKRKKYVDPATLLFSVEHKDVIEKTKESNVAAVDLNGR